MAGDLPCKKFIPDTKRVQTGNQLDDMNRQLIKRPVAVYYYFSKKGHYTHQLSNALKPTDGIAHRINTRPLIIIQINMQMNPYCLLQ
jgi:hypothetical protein